MNIDNYLSLLLVEGYSKNKSINPYQEICEYSVLYFKYLSDEDKKDYIKIFGFHPLQLKKWISKSNINNYRNLDYFIFVIVLQYLLLKSVLEIYKSGKIEETMDKFEKVLTNKISNNEVKENIKNMFKNNKQSNQSNQQQPPQQNQQQTNQQQSPSSSQQSPPSSQQQSSQQYNQSNQQQQSSQQSNQSNQQQQSPSSSSQQQSSQQYNQSNQQQPPQQQQSNQQQQNQQQSNQQQQNQQEEAERQRKQQEKENLEKQKEELQKEKENLENTINLEEDKKREIDVVNELLTTYIERLNNLNLEL